MRKKRKEFKGSLINEILEEQEKFREDTTDEMLELVKSIKGIHERVQKNIKKDNEVSSCPTAWLNLGHWPLGRCNRERFEHNSFPDWNIIWFAEFGDYFYVYVLEFNFLRSHHFLYDVHLYEISSKVLVTCKGLSRE